jgi:hypothetical protein
MAVTLGCEVVFRGDECYQVLEKHVKIENQKVCLRVFLA